MDDKKIRQLKTIAIYSVAGIGSATGLFFLGRHFIKKARANISEKRSLEEGDPATFAKQLKMAFDNDNYFGWGTNWKVVQSVFEAIPSKAMYSKVQREYMNIYGKSLNADLEDELSSEEYNELIRILNAKA
ncbi:hypothetical protein KK083_21475 [Fulvivirgaceae bacterium PWU4]|uniref:Annexin n=1 Tax=Chryseosolibacter histidini TaxID=2782349 RepID=A0AAP2DNB7_9BACT|nr:annexin [Chryseosolibacter histidini]MBT1699483.1 hypothetical protein [Chryseosolibacter histidini]